MTRLTPELINEMAWECSSRQAILANQGDALRLPFMLMLALMGPDEYDFSEVFALYGHVQDSVPGRAINGYPIFTAARFLNKEDALAVHDRMRTIYTLRHGGTVEAAGVEPA